MALNFPNTPADGQIFTDTNGQQWVYETATNSWTALGAQSGGMIYKGGINVVTTAPAGAQSGWLYVANTAGVADASFTGIAGKAIKQGEQIIYNGSSWDLITNVNTGVFVGETPPPTPANGQEWWHSGEGRLYIYYDEGGTSGSKQWVAATPEAEVDQVWQRSGTTISPKTTGDNIQLTSLNGGPLAGFRNILINGNLTINQRGADVASVGDGNYGQDRWKKTAGGMTQIIEEGNFEPGATYTLSGTGITTKQLTAPASGNWTLPDVPVTARKIQLELGPVATPFEQRPLGIELALCQRYYLASTARCYLHLLFNAGAGVPKVGGNLAFPNPMRAVGSFGQAAATITNINTAGGAAHPFQVLVHPEGIAFSGQQQTDSDSYIENIKVDAEL